jgi:hypothetical protein
MTRQPNRRGSRYATKAKGAVVMLSSLVNNAPGKNAAHSTLPTTLLRDRFAAPTTWQRPFSSRVMIRRRPRDQH